MKIRYTNTVEHLVAFNHFHMSRSPVMRWIRWKIPLALAGLIVLTGIRVNRPGEILSIVASVIVAGLFLLFMWLSRAVSTWFFVRRLLTEGKNSSVLCEHELEVMPDGLVEISPVSELRSKWESVERIESTSDYTFVYIQATAAHVIPRRAVAEGDYETFAVALREARTLAVRSS